MKSFLKVCVAALAGVLIGFLIISIVGVTMIGGIAGSMSGSSKFVLKDKTVLMIDLNGSLDERKSESPLNSLMGMTSTGQNDVLEAIREAKENDKVNGIYLKCRNLSSGIATLEPVRKALVDFKETGKFVVSYSDSYDQGTYYLASTADKIIMNPKGSLSFHGLRMQVQFSRGMYEQMGVKYQVFKVGTFKSAVEPYIQDKMSDANREQSSALLNDVWSYWLGNISESRHISVETLNEYADKSLLFYEADSVLKFDMVDTLMYGIEMEKYLKDLTGTNDEGKLNIASVKNMVSVAENGKNKKSKNEIAVLYADGAIVMNDDNSNFLSGNIISAHKYMAEIQKLKEDKDVKAVVLRVNSPGGSAYASEQIWNAIEDLKKEKPVVVSMGDYAASGGYYISCGATCIVAEPTTLTGSIGIFSLIPEGEELAKKIGFTFDEVKTNKHAGFGGSVFRIPFIISAHSRGLTDEEAKMLQGSVERGYDLFITRCAEGRSKTKDEIDAIGQGRVWTGNQALAYGLVDKLGSLDDAVKIATEAAEIADYAVKDYPKKVDFMTELLKSSMGGSKMKIAKFIMGEEEFQQQKLLQVLKNTEICIAEMPERISF
ncbi:MAG: signal peptide peptidase SppA [Tannerella sp.]|jgi:protease-4|nr:signal peptide peptidase SppA [Tannerella sp.]